MDNDKKAILEKIKKLNAELHEEIQQLNKDGYVLESKYNPVTGDDELIARKKV